ncbi:type II secretion system protein GspD [Photobacterium leiognathi]|uniref:type II secretion system protein GspD n=1 Tax=Photobacterium leiognathi TaxID=553611 RepID=UPI002980E656|nr:hypothetical protein [Photobacterium leiognathi]
MTNNKFLKSALSLALVGATSIAVTGCGSTDYLVQQNKAEKIGNMVEKAREAANSNYIDHPPVDLTASLPVKFKPSWVDAFTVSINVKKAPLEVVMDQISESTGLTFVWGGKAKLDLPITLNKKGASLSEVFHAIEAKTGYQIDTSEREAIGINAEITKSFPLMKFAGANSFLIGKKSGGDMGGGDDVGGMFSSDSDQFSNIEANKIDAAKDIVKTIKNIGGDAFVSLNEATGSVTVTGKPANVKRIGNYIAEINKQMGQMVRVDAKIVVFTSRNANSFNVDLDLVKKATDGVLNFSSGGSSSAVSGLTNLAKFSAVSTNGSMAGTSLFIEALRQQGVVSVSTEPSLTALNNQVGEINSVHKEAYAASVGIGSIGDSNISNGAISSVEQKVIVTGFSMRSLVKVVNDEIMLQFSGTVSEQGDSKTFKYEGAELVSPQMDENSFNQSATLLDGQTLILTGYNQESAKAASDESFHNPYLGGNGGKDQYTQTMVLLTAHLI